MTLQVHTFLQANGRTISYLGVRTVRVGRHVPFLVSLNSARPPQAPGQPSKKSRLPTGIQFLPSLAIFYLRFREVADIKSNKKKQRPTQKRPQAQQSG